MEGKLTNIKEFCDLGRSGHGNVRLKLDHLRKVGVKIDDIFTFSGVRNPWDRQVRLSEPEVVHLCPSRCCRMYGVYLSGISWRR